jgi:AcrR family transcriptional regulator
MKSATGSRAYRQGVRAETAEANTQRILEAALELFAELPFDQITLGQVSERAGVGLQTLIRRVGTKDGLVSAVNEWIQPVIGSARGEPSSADPSHVAAALAPQYERWGALIDRTLRQEDVSPALAEGAEGGRAAHRAWIDAAFAEALAARRPAVRRRLRARLVAICGVELWLVLRRDEGLTVAEARETVADLVSACLAGPRTVDHGKEQKR